MARPTIAFRGTSHPPTSDRTAVTTVVHQSLGSCSAHPGCGWYIGYGRVTSPTSWPSIRTRSALTLLVPTSTPTKWVSFIPNWHILLGQDRCTGCTDPSVGIAHDISATLSDPTSRPIPGPRERQARR